VSGRAAHVRAGWQELVFRETDAPIPPNEGHHIQVYLADFSTPHRKLLERGLITAENNAHEYRFTEIVDLVDGRSRFTLEHEMRSMRHPLFGRTLVNRDTTIDPLSFVTGREAFAWASASP
jgi:hypothetical protein